MILHNFTVKQSWLRNHGGCRIKNDLTISLSDKKVLDVHRRDKAVLFVVNCLVSVAMVMVYGQWGFTFEIDVFRQGVF